MTDIVSITTPGTDAQAEAGADAGLPEVSRARGSIAGGRRKGTGGSGVMKHQAGGRGWAWVRGTAAACSAHAHDLVGRRIREVTSVPPLERWRAIHRTVPSADKPPSRPSSAQASPAMRRKRIQVRGGGACVPHLTTGKGGASWPDRKATHCLAAVY